MKHFQSETDGTGLHLETIIWATSGKYTGREVTERKGSTDLQVSGSCQRSVAVLSLKSRIRHIALQPGLKEKMGAGCPWAFRLACQGCSCHPGCLV